MILDGLNEAIVEEAAHEWFVELGYAVGYGPHLAPGEQEVKRGSFGVAVLVERLHETILKLNTAFRAQMCAEASS